MNARDRILERLWLAIPSSDNEEAQLKATQMLDDFAHELAEKIRGGVHEWEGMSALVCAHNRGKFDAADLIDPEVSEGPTCLPRSSS